MSRRSFFLSEKLKNPQIFQISLTYSKKDFEKTFWQGFEKCIVLSTVTIWRKTFFLRIWFLLLSEKLSKYFMPLAKKTERSCQKINLRIQGAFCLSEKLENAQMCIFLVLPVKKSLRKLLGRVVKCVLVLSRATFWEKLVLRRFVFFFLLGNWMKIFWLLAKETKPSCQKIVSGVQRILFLVRKT